MAGQYLTINKNTVFKSSHLNIIIQLLLKKHGSKRSKSGKAFRVGAAT